jgi:hypothetical protein
MTDGGRVSSGDRRLKVKGMHLLTILELMLLLIVHDTTPVTGLKQKIDASQPSTFLALFGLRKNFCGILTN